MIDEASNVVAHRLIEGGLQREEVVMIYAARKVELVVAVMGTLKAGGVFSVIGKASLFRSMCVLIEKGWKLKDSSLALAILRPRLPSLSTDCLPLRRQPSCPHRSLLRWNHPPNRPRLCRYLSREPSPPAHPCPQHSPFRRDSRILDDALVRRYPFLGPPQGQRIDGRRSWTGQSRDAFLHEREHRYPKGSQGSTLLVDPFLPLDGGEVRFGRGCEVYDVKRYRS
jgi:hypothetical protein